MIIDQPTEQNFTPVDPTLQVRHEYLVETTEDHLWDFAYSRKVMPSEIDLLFKSKCPGFVATGT